MLYRDSGNWKPKVTLSFFVRLLGAIEYTDNPLCSGDVTMIQRFPKVVNER